MQLDVDGVRNCLDCYGVSPTQVVTQMPGEVVAVDLLEGRVEFARDRCDGLGECTVCLDLLIHTATSGQEYRLTLEAPQSYKGHDHSSGL